MDAVTYERDLWKGLMKGSPTEKCCKDIFKENFFDLSNKRVCVNKKGFFCVDKKNGLSLSVLIYCKPYRNRKMLSLGVAVLLDTVNKLSLQSFILHLMLKYKGELLSRVLDVFSWYPYTLHLIFTTISVHVSAVGKDGRESLFGLGRVKAHPTTDAILLE